MKPGYHPRRIVVDRKWCARGKHWSPAHLFGKTTITKDGLERFCRVCLRDYRRIRHLVRVEEGRHA